jgi:CRISPR-associated endoribonuclease Cas6
MPDLLSFQLILRPVPADEAVSAGALPPWWGRAAYSLLLRTVRQYDEQLAASLHDEPPPGEAAGVGASSNTVRPFSVSNLLGRFPHGGLDPQGAYALRFTSLTAGLSQILLQAGGPGGPLAAGALVELDRLPFRVEDVRLLPAGQAKADEPQAAQEAMPWLGADDYAGLSAALLLAKTPAPRRLTLQFASPTTFKSGGKHLPVPLPELVFGSLLERWNAFAPVIFPPEARRYAQECLALGRYQLSTRPVPGKGGGLRIGAVGQAAYTSINYDRYWMSLVGVLAAFARYAGVGAGVTQGLGQCRQVIEAEPLQDSQAGGG